MVVVVTVVYLIANVVLTSILTVMNIFFSVEYLMLIIMLNIFMKLKLIKNLYFPRFVLCCIILNRTIYLYFKQVTFLSRFIWITEIGFMWCREYNAKEICIYLGNMRYRYIKLCFMFVIVVWVIEMWLFCGIT